MGIRRWAVLCNLYDLFVFRVCYVILSTLTSYPIYQPLVDNSCYHEPLEDIYRSSQVLQGTYMDCRTCNLKYLLGLQMFEEGLRYPLCHAVANPFGDHQVDCGGNRERILRHNSIGDAVISLWRGNASTLIHRCP